MEGFNDEAPVTVRVWNYGQRDIGTQVFVNREPCYGVLGFTESLWNSRSPMDDIERRMSTPASI